ncbi:hypothetical protein O6H91_22G032200 [Diphasiastrum complanatum]|nr:hypothetical protein O6H91_22G032200 [Diphasiastrum complanatum]
MMDVASYKRKSSLDHGDSDKKRKHESSDMHDEEEQKETHRNSEERHSKHKHKHKHHRHGHGSHRKHKHEHRRKSGKVIEELDGDSRIYDKGDRDGAGHEIRANKVGRDVKALEIVISEQYNREEGEISEDQIFTKAATESEIESGEIKSDGESAEIKKDFNKSTVGLLLSGSKESVEAVSANMMVKAGLALAEDSELPGLAISEDAGLWGKDIRGGDRSPIKSMSITDAYGADGHSSGDDLRGDITIVNHSHLFQEFSEEIPNVEVESLEIGHTVEETFANTITQCETDDIDGSCKEKDLREDTVGKCTGEMNKSLFSVGEESLIEVNSSKDLKLCSLKDRDGSMSTRGFELKDEEALSPFRKDHNDGIIDIGQSPEQRKIRNSKHHVPSESTKNKLHDERCSQPQVLLHDRPLRLEGSSDGRDLYQEVRRSRSRERKQSHTDERKRSPSREIPRSHSRERRQSHTDERKRSRSREVPGNHSLERKAVPSKRRRSHSRENRRSLPRDAVFGRSPPREDMEKSRRYSPPSRRTQSRLQKDGEGTQERNRRSRSRDLIAKSQSNIDSFDRMHPRESLKSSRVDSSRTKLSRSHAYSPEKRNRRSRSRESVQNYRRENREHMRHDYGQTASPYRRQRSRSRDTLKDGRGEDRGTSRYVRGRDRDHMTSYKDSQNPRERYRNEDLRNSYSENSHNRHRHLEKDRSNHDQSKTGQNSSKKTTDFSSEEKAREEENQEVYVERVALQLAAQEEDDVEKIKEESRRRRQAILEKYKNQKSKQQESRETATDMFREVPSANEHAGEAQPGGSSSRLEAGNEKQNGAVGPTGGDLSDATFMHGATLVLGKGPLQKENVLKGYFGGIVGLGEGSPKSERSPDIFCDDIFGESPAGGRRAGKGDGLTIDNSGLIDNWDDAEGYYCYRIGEVLDGRYEVASSHGRGVFSHVVRARDLKAGRGDAEEVAIKIIRNNETMFKAGQTELVILKKLAGADPENRRHCVRLLSSFEYRSHLCLVFESLHMNLREVLKKFGRNIGINLQAVRAYAKQLFIALKHLRNCGVLHCDIKPDNMLVNEAKNVLKLCDFGSAMFAGENEITPYLVSRFYRAPEIILGLPYDHALDIWSVGCCLYELYTGKVLFPGPTNNDMLKLHMELKGPFPKKMLKKAAFRDQHFDQDYNFCAVEEDPVTKKMVKRILTNVKPLDIGALIGRSGTVDEDSKMIVNFKDLLDKVFILDPDKRLTVSQALSHPFISGK